MLFKYFTFHNFPLRIFGAAQYFPSHLSEALHSGHCATAEISAFSSSFRFSLSFTSIIATFCDLRCQTDFTLCNTYFTFLIFYTQMCIMPIALPPAANYCFFDGANEPKAKTENGGRVCLPPPMSLQRPDAVPASAMSSAKRLPKKFCFVFANFCETEDFSPLPLPYILYHIFRDLRCQTYFTSCNTYFTFFAKYNV